MNRILVSIDVPGDADPEAVVEGLKRLTASPYNRNIVVKPAVPPVYATFDNLQFVSAETVPDAPVVAENAVESAVSA